ncbi:MAG TPA: porin family protein [Burkholderiales bacterium]|nr:porin family protein [Burkholderiales bacterium]
MRGRLACIAAVVFLFTAGARAQSYDPEVQRSFVEGARLMRSGDYEAAARIFRTLLATTGSPRIKLELARALFYQKRYEEARALFKEVLLDPGVPWRVRDNVEAFIREMDNIEGYLKLSVSVVSDSNPRNITRQREFTIGGVRLTFLPPQDNKRVTGLRYSAQAFKPLLPQSGLSAYFTGSYLDYPNITLDRLTVDLGLAKDLGDSHRASVRAGLESGTFGGKPLYDFPYVAAAYQLSRSFSHRLTGEAKFGQVNFPDFGYLDATYVSATLAGMRSISPTVALSAAATAERSEAHEKPYSYSGLTVAPGLTWLLTQPAFLVKTGVSFGGRDYAAEDPLFGIRRSDRRTALDIALTSKEWRLMNFSPVLILSLEKNRSNIDFYSYEKVNLSLAFE